MTQAGAERRLDWRRIIAYCMAFYAAWALREFFIKPLRPDTMNPWLAAFLGGGVKLVVWTLPAWLLLRRYPGDMAVKRWFSEPMRWARLLPWIGVIIGYNIIYALVRGDGLRISPDFDPLSLVGTVLFVGITEEAVFRGLLLNTFLTRMRENAALALSAGLFVLIHVPVWTTQGLFAVPLDALRTAGMIFVLGIAFGMSFIRERSLLPPIILHMTWNLAVVLLQGG